MNIDNPNFRDGRIEEVKTTADYVSMKISCAKVDRGELLMDISSNGDGWIHLHFSGLGGKQIITANQSANEVDIFVKNG